MTSSPGLTSLSIAAISSAEVPDVDQQYLAGTEPLLQQPLALLGVRTVAGSLTRRHAVGDMFDFAARYEESVEWNAVGHATLKEAVDPCYQGTPRASAART